MQEGAPSSPRSSLVEAFGTLVGSDLFSDVVFVVDSQRIPAHRAVLAARSSFFRQLFQESPSDTLKVEGVRLQIFMAVLKYLYTARIDVDPRLALEMVVAADRFGLSDMKAHCFGKIEQTFDDSNVCDILSLADQHGAESLKQACLRFIHDHYAAVMRSPSFKSLKKDLILEIVRSR